MMDDGVFVQYYFPDTDGDGFGDSNNPLLRCLPIDTIPAGYVGMAGDGNEAHPLMYPAAPELGDGLDNDCDGQANDGLPLFAYFADADGDGYGNPDEGLDTCLTIPPTQYAANKLDCDDANPAINPAQPEIPGDGLDNDCDGLADNVSSTTETDRRFRVYPNPVSDRLTVESAMGGTLIYEISDMRGKLLRAGEVGVESGRLQISFAAELPGVYLLRLREQGGAEAMVRVVKI